MAAERRERHCHPAGMVTHGTQTVRAGIFNMADVIHSVTCGKCERTIAAIVPSAEKEGLLSIAKLGDGRIPLVMRRRSKTSHDYSFFCHACNHFEHWTSDGREFLADSNVLLLRSG